MRSRWKVFRGESRDDKDLIFSVRRSSVFQMKTKHVFLANNKSENVCDYTIRGSWFERSCKIFAGTSSTIAAQVRSFTAIYLLIIMHRSLTSSSSSMIY